MSELLRTHRPTTRDGAEALQALVYVRQQCHVHELQPGSSVRVGRGPENDIRIDDSSVSRRHLLLHVGTDVDVEVEDLGSANGTLHFRSEQDRWGEEATQRNELDSRLVPGQRKRLGPGDFVRAGVALIVVQGVQPRLRSTVSAVSSRPQADSGPPVLIDPEMKKAYEVAMRAAQSGISVLITGETGVGKEIFAETIHTRSTRRDKPLLRLNCAALSETLLESELFGHERGAFTGATQTKVGLLESNDQGSVFLDEIGEMPLSTQAKLLRVLEEKTILRVGATKPRTIDVRFIWATNRDLRAEARRGRFRQDLYYRIAGVEFSIPPLRRRQVEIEPLARLFLERFCRRSGIPIPQLTDEAVAALHAYSWPGNVRELKNVMERMPFMCAGGPITAEHIPTDPGDGSDLFPAEEMEATDVFIPSRPLAEPRPSGPQPVPVVSSAPPQRFRGQDPSAERLLITEALEQCGGNQTRAARLLGVSRRTLINHIERLNVPRPKKG